MRNFSLFSLLTLLLLGNFNAVLAESTVQDDLEKLSAFQNQKTIDDLDLIVPTVVEVPFATNEKTGYDLAVLENESQTFQPWILVSETEDQENQNVSTENKALVDGNTLTYAEYEVPAESKGTVDIILTTEEAVRSSSITFWLDQHVALPTHLSIEVQDGNNKKEILSRTPMKSTTVSFPETEATQWIIHLEYSQLLRISEIELTQENNQNKATQAIRFLAQPDTSYTIYFNADRPVNITTGESGNLTKDEGVKTQPSINSEKNETYQKEDTDEDGIPDETDNCVSVANADQTDQDANDRGDPCDDYDRDGVINHEDNCDNEPNARQNDEDGDGVGDSCDEEESRVTERYPWLPWTGMGLAVAIIGFLFYKTAKEKR